MRARDDQILLFAAAHRSDVLDSFFRAATWLGSLYVLVPTALLITIVLLQQFPLKNILLQKQRDRIGPEKNFRKQLASYQ